MAVRTIVIQRNQAGQLVADVLESTLRVARAAVIQYLRQGKVRLAGHPCQVPGRRVRAGQRLEVTVADVKKPVKEVSQRINPDKRQRVATARKRPGPSAPAVK